MRHGRHGYISSYTFFTYIAHLTYKAAEPGNRFYIILLPHYFLLVLESTEKDICILKVSANINMVDTFNWFHKSYTSSVNSESMVYLLIHWTLLLWLLLRGCLFLPRYQRSCSCLLNSALIAPYLVSFESSEAML